MLEQHSITSLSGGSPIRAVFMVVFAFSAYPVLGSDYRPFFHVSCLRCELIQTVVPMVLEKLVVAELNSFQLKFLKSVFRVHHFSLSLCLLADLIGGCFCNLY